MKEIAICFSCSAYLIGACWRYLSFSVDYRNPNLPLFSERV